MSEIRDAHLACADSMCAICNPLRVQAVLIETREEAAALRAENERLREALRRAAKHAERCHPESGVVHFGVDSGVTEWQRDMVVVRAALAGQEVGR